MLDTLIKNGTVVDGSGKRAFKADVGVERGRISLVGRAEGAQTAAEIDATGKIVCPGIVDPHSHADLPLFRDDHTTLLEPLVRQGITTFVGGNCGVSLAPIGNTHLDLLKEYIGLFSTLDFERDVTWNSMGEFLDTLDSNGILLNFAPLAPHGLLRVSALGPERHYATDEEQRQMARALDQCLEEGAIGLSTGLQYYPGNHSNTPELAALGQVLKKHDAIFTSHLRSYSSTTLDRAIDEVIEIARTNGIRAQISHLFWAPESGRLGPIFRKVLRQLAKLPAWCMAPLPLDLPLAARIRQFMKVREQGVCVGCDVMPTTTAFTHLLAYFPPWALEGKYDEIVARLSDPAQRTQMLYSIEHGKSTWPHVERGTWSLNFFKQMGWESIHIMSVASERNKHLEGMRLVDIAVDRNKHPFDAACDLLIEEHGHVFVFMAMAQPGDPLTERSTFAPIKHPEISISTDTLLGMGKSSPLFHACYPKFIGRYVRDKKLLSLESAVRKMTALPAGHFALKQRGTLREGYHADILVFDFGTIASCSTFDVPDRAPTGIDHVLINGKHILDNGTYHPDPKPGQVLRKT